VQNARWIEGIHKYKIVDWKLEHNHPFAVDEHKQFLDSFCTISPLTAIVSKMHDHVGVPLRATFDFLSNCTGGKDKVGCTRRDLQNHRDFVRRNPLKDGDGKWLYEYFLSVKAKDATFFYKVKMDSNCQIESIFWADGKMQIDCHYFAHSISFDTTYRTNDQFRPLGALYVVFIKNNLHTFFGEFSRKLENKRYDELQEDFNAFRNQPTVLYPHSLLVEHASEFYTPKIFKKFQNEYAVSLDLSVGGNFPPVHGGGMHEITWCRITMPDAKRVDEHVVTFSLDEFTYKCSCLLFDSSGWLCRHILRTMDTISMLGNTAAWSISTFYMRSRWSITAKKGAALHGFVVECMEQETEFGRFQRLCGSALPLSTDAAFNQEITDYVAEQMSWLHVDVRRMTMEHRSKAPLPTQQAPHDAAIPQTANEELLASTSFKKRNNPNKVTRRIKSSQEIVRRKMKKTKKKKTLIAEVVAEYVEQMKK
ncbi:Protein FAR1-RELATED SEQUENCE 7, partial [Linum perenne]